MSRGALLLLLPIILLAACGGSGANTSATPAPTPGPPRAPAPHLSRADCAALAARVQAVTRSAPHQASEPTPPLSHCRLSAPGVDVNVYLDAAHEARQRYENRMVEQVQFNAPDPARIPHYVPGVGQPGAYGHFASWIPAYDTLFAVRGERWLTVAYARSGVPRTQLRAEAAALARAAFPLTVK